METSSRDPIWAWIWYDQNKVLYLSIGLSFMIAESRMKVKLCMATLMNTQGQELLWALKSSVVLVWP